MGGEEATWVHQEVGCCRQLGLGPLGCLREACGAHTFLRDTGWGEL